MAKNATTIIITTAVIAIGTSYLFYKTMLSKPKKHKLKKPKSNLEKSFDPEIKSRIKTKISIKSLQRLKVKINEDLDARDLGSKNLKRMLSFLNSFQIKDYTEKEEISIIFHVVKLAIRYLKVLEFNLASQNIEKNTIIGNSVFITDKRFWEILDGLECCDKTMKIVNLTQKLFFCMRNKWYERLDNAIGEINEIDSKGEELDINSLYLLVQSSLVSGRWDVFERTSNLLLKEYQVNKTPYIHILYPLTPRILCLIEILGNKLKKDDNYKLLETNPEVKFLKGSKRQIKFEKFNPAEKSIESMKKGEISERIGLLEGKTFELDINGAICSCELIGPNLELDTFYGAVVFNKLNGEVEKVFLASVQPENIVLSKGEKDWEGEALFLNGLKGLKPVKFADIKFSIK